MSSLIIEIIVILLLLIVNGVFAMTEMAVVSSRRARLRVMAAGGHAGAAAALALAESPNRFLPSVQCGITLVGLLAGAFGGITIAEQIVAVLTPLPRNFAANPDRVLRRKPEHAPLRIRARAGLRIGGHYPEPIVSHAIARQVALEAFARIKSPTVNVLSPR